MHYIKVNIDKIQFVRFLQMDICSVHFNMHFILPRLSVYQLSREIIISAGCRKKIFTNSGV